MDREARAEYDLVAEAKDGGSPARSARVPVKVLVLDANDNSPEIVDPHDDVLSVREEQAPGTEVGHLRAVDRDLGANASVTFSIIRGRSTPASWTSAPLTKQNAQVFHVFLLSQTPHWRRSVSPCVNAKR